MSGGPEEVSGGLDYVFCSPKEKFELPRNLLSEFVGGRVV